MKSEKYVMSGNCRILDKDELKFKENDYSEEVALIKSEQLFILERKGNWYLANPTIKIFLDQFRDPEILSNVISRFSKKLNCSVQKIEEPIRSFFKTMVDRKILIPESKFIDTTDKDGSKTQHISEGTEIGNYIFEKRIFTNQKVEIYKAITIDNKIPVAIKILKERSPKKKSINSFVQEFFLLDELGYHPNICQFIELVQMEDISFGVLEFVDGLAGRKYIKQNRLTFTSIIYILTQFFDAMAFLHRHKFLHGDLHLSNLIIDTNCCLKIIDFNMSNRAQPLEDEIIREGGVHQYIAPEKINCNAFKIVNGPANYESEVYQMGIIMYYFLYEKMPFSGFTWKELAATIGQLNPAFENESSAGEKIPTEIVNFLKLTLDRNPKNRFRDADNLFSEWKKISLANLHLTRLESID